jgi:hypothetical protein
MLQRQNRYSFLLALLVGSTSVACVEELDAVKGTQDTTGKIDASGGSGKPGAAGTGGGGTSNGGAAAGTSSAAGSTSVGGTGAGANDGGVGGTGAGANDGVGGTGAGASDGGVGGTGVGGSSGESVLPPPTEATIIVKGVGGPLAVDDTWLFVGGSEGIPVRANKGGGEPVSVAPGASVGGKTIELLALDGTHVYWSIRTGVAAQYELWRAPKLGGGAELINSEPAPNFAYPTALVVDDAFVYLSMPDQYNGNDLENRTGVIRRIPKAGGPSKQLFEAYSRNLALDGDHLYWSEDKVGGLSELHKGAKDGSSAEVLASELGPINAIGAREGRLFWSFLDSGLYFTRSTAPGQPVLSLASTEKMPGPYAVAADAVYWLVGGDSLDGQVWRQGIDGSLSVLATAPASSNQALFAGAFGARIAIDESAVYWSYEGAQGGAPRVYRLAR